MQALSTQSVTLPQVSNLPLANARSLAMIASVVLFTSACRASAPMTSAQFAGALQEWLTKTSARLTSSESSKSSMRPVALSQNGRHSVSEASDQDAAMFRALTPLMRMLSGAAQPLSRSAFSFRIEAMLRPFGSPSYSSPSTQSSNAAPAAAEVRQALKGVQRWARRRSLPKSTIAQCKSEKDMPRLTCGSKGSGPPGRGVQRRVHAAARSSDLASRSSAGTSAGTMVTSTP
mmetsp:Transcript_15377/g.44035  ORF Transcript_15377/g.44035 Transcript_15377/m.44035 type:complete len:232 (-) Transcript_15377:545-1240(-)